MSLGVWGGGGTKVWLKIQMERCIKGKTQIQIRFNLYFHALQLYSIEIAKKVEVDGGAELTEEFLYSEIHPVSFCKVN